MPKFNIQQEDYEIKKREPAKQKEVTESKKHIDIDDSVPTASVNSSSSPKQDKKTVKQPDAKKEVKTMVFKQKVREKKSVHKSFLITESMNQKFSKLAKMNGYNENEFFIEILNQLFESYKDELNIK